jgi:hypothetical protein
MLCRTDGITPLSDLVEGPEVVASLVELWRARLVVLRPAGG